jgi:hypothetical protein
MGQHPTDLLIRRLIQTGGVAAPAEIEQIVERMATAPFDRREIPIPMRLRGFTYQGESLGARHDSFGYHLVKRVVDERQWAHGTTAADYLADLRRGVRNRRARLAVYERRGGFMAAALAATSAAVPSARRGTEALPSLLVVYSTDRGVIISGYQVSSFERTGIPGEALWLR